VEFGIMMLYIGKINMKMVFVGKLHRIKYVENKIILNY
jgi:hypothetical protein